MKIKSLAKRTDTGYTFKIAFGPFWLDGWWYNTDSNNVIPPSKFVGNRRFSLVQSHALHFGRLRNVVKYMVANGLESFNSDSFIAPASFDPKPGEPSAVEEEVSVEVVESPDTEDRWAGYFKDKPTES